MIPDLHISKTPAASVTKMLDDTWHLEIPANHKGGYQLAQLDDHGKLSRKDFLWRPPIRLSLQARASAQELPGTWGFGFWNDPFSFLIAYGGIVPRFPTLPEAVWFFHASPQNYLSLRNDLPANGFLAATFRSKKVPSTILALSSPLMAFTFIPGAAQGLRRLFRKVIDQDTALIQTNVMEWHAYLIQWDALQIRLSVDGTVIAETKVTPRGPLSLVIWIDNQYAALPPRGGLRYGLLANPEPAWLELRELSIEKIP